MNVNNVGPTFSPDFGTHIFVSNTYTGIDRSLDTRRPRQLQLAVEQSGDIRLPASVVWWRPGLTMREGRHDCVVCGGPLCYSMYHTMLKIGVKDPCPECLA